MKEGRALAFEAETAAPCSVPRWPSKAITGRMHLHAHAQPAPALRSTLAAKGPVFGLMPAHVETMAWKQDQKEAMCLRPRMHKDSRRMYSNPLRACRPWAEAGLCHTVLSLCSPISSFLAQNGPAIFISL